MHLSTAHLNKFWKLFQEAVSENLPANADKEKKRSFRLKLIADSTGKTSLTQVRPGLEYELLMAATAALTDDTQAQVYWTTTGERKFVFLIGICITQIGQIAQEPHAWNYVRGVLHQANWPEDWHDISNDMLHTVFQMLDTHRRRLLDRAGWMGSKFNQPLGFNQHRSYIYSPSGLSFRDDLPITPVKPEPSMAQG